MHKVNVLPTDRQDVEADTYVVKRKDDVCTCAAPSQAAIRKRSFDADVSVDMTHISDKCLCGDRSTRA